MRRTESGRHLPAGYPGYPLYTRQNAMLRSDEVSQETRAVREGVSRSTVQRWDKRMAQSGSLEPSRPPGRPLSLMPESAAKLLWYKQNVPQARLTECLSFLRTVCPNNEGVANVKLHTISRELKRLGMSKKQMKYWQKDCDEQARVNYWCNGPMEGAEWYPGRPRLVHGVHQVAGILGVPVELMIDIDEKPLSIASAKRRFGHSFIGQPCSTGGQYKRGARSLSLLMAVDVKVGVVAHWIYEGSTVKETIVVFLGVFLLPKIRGLRRVLLLDNHSTHFGAEMEALLRAEGHIYVARPPNSPEFSPIEPMFHLVEENLKTYHHWDTRDDNLESVADDAVSMITAEHVESAFVHSHYFVKGRDFNPYIYKYFLGPNVTEPDDKIAA